MQAQTHCETWSEVEKRYLRQIGPVNMACGFCSAGGPHNSARRALLKCWQQQAGQVGMTKEVGAYLSLQTTDCKVASVCMQTGANAPVGQVNVPQEDNACLSR